jgi:hypothetical protein
MEKSDTNMRATGLKRRPAAARPYAVSHRRDDDLPVFAAMSAMVAPSDPFSDLLLLWI